MNTNTNPIAVEVIPAAFSAAVSAYLFEAVQLKPRMHRDGISAVVTADAGIGRTRHPRGIPL
jgi:hypothetical protein